MQKKCHKSAGQFTNRGMLRTGLQFIYVTLKSSLTKAQKFNISYKRPSSGKTTITAQASSTIPSLQQKCSDLYTCQPGVGECVPPSKFLLDPSDLEDNNALKEHFKFKRGVTRNMESSGRLSLVERKRLKTLIKDSLVAILCLQGRNFESSLSSCSLSKCSPELVSKLKSVSTLRPKYKQRDEL